MFKQHPVDRPANAGRPDLADRPDLSSGDDRPRPVFLPAPSQWQPDDAGGQFVGSALIGQQTDDPRYFWSRPSAVDYMLGINPGLWLIGCDELRLDQPRLSRRRYGSAAEAMHQGTEDDRAIPADLLFASGSGLDPDISPEAARLQIDRVAAARDLDPQQVATLVDSSSRNRSSASWGNRVSMYCGSIWPWMH